MYFKKAKKICLVKTTNMITYYTLHITTAIADKASFLIRSHIAPRDVAIDASRRKIQITTK